MFNVLCIVLLVCDISVFYHCLFSIKKYKNISEDIKIQSNNISVMKKSLYYKIQPKYGTIETLDIFEDFIQGKIKYSKAELLDKTINIQIPMTNKNSYYDLISTLDGIHESIVQEIESDSNEKSSENTLKVELKIK